VTRRRSGSRQREAPPTRFYAGDDKPSSLSRSFAFTCHCRDRAAGARLADGGFPRLLHGAGLEPCPGAGDGRRPHPRQAHRLPAGPVIIGIDDTISQTMWKFQAHSCKDSSKPCATRRKMCKVELRDAGARAPPHRTTVNSRLQRTERGQFQMCQAGSPSPIEKKITWALPTRFSNGT
jgi:hypothetical protein